ncbi:MAG: glycosyltransferase family 4 protein [Betaproteobacteria bacterium]
MRLAFITGSLVHGGAERHSITLANRLAERGHECHAVYVKNDPSQLDRLRLEAPSSVRCLYAGSYLDRRALGGLSRFLRELAPHAVLACNPYALFYTSLARPAAPILVTLHSTRNRSLKESAQMLVYRPLFWAADCAVFVSERQRAHWRRRGLFGRSNRVIYNGVDTDHWQPVCAAPRNEKDFVIGMSAVLRPEKNPTQLVDAVAALCRRGVPARALFIGDGPLRGEVEARAAREGIADRVTITGLQQDVRPYLGACDTLVLTSFTEAFSLAAVEAMALGLPVVHSDVGGAAEMITHGEDGFLFPVGDTRSLVESLAVLAQPEARRRLGAHARATVETRFTERAMVERYEQTLMDMASTRSNREQLRRRAAAH